jgi:hypothetical protein
LGSNGPANLKPVGQHVGEHLGEGFLGHLHVIVVIVRRLGHVLLVEVGVELLNDRGEGRLIVIVPFGVLDVGRVGSELFVDGKGVEPGVKGTQGCGELSEPARYTANPACFRSRLDRLNTVLTFSDLDISEQGKVKIFDAADTIGQALERANRLHAALVQRAVQADVLRCTRSQSEGDKRRERSKRLRRLASAVEWLAGEAKPPGVT